MLGVAFGLEGRDAGAVLGPLVVPEGFVLALVVFPVGGHVGEEVGGAEGVENRADVGVGARRVTACIEAAIAAVGPGVFGLVYHVYGCVMVWEREREEETHHSP